MAHVEVDELRMQSDRVLRRVRDGETIEIADHGRVIARLVPAADAPSMDDALLGSGEDDRPLGADETIPAPTQLRDRLARLDELAAEIGAEWPAGVSAVDAVRDVRRDL
jgi:prevent-host-death family protein